MFNADLYAFPKPPVITPKPSCFQGTFAQGANTNFSFGRTAKNWMFCFSETVRIAFSSVSLQPHVPWAHHFEISFNTERETENNLPQPLTAPTQAPTQAESCVLGLRANGFLPPELLGLCRLLEGSEEDAQTALQGLEQKTHVCRIRGPSGLFLILLTQNLALSTNPLLIALASGCLLQHR